MESGHPDGGLDRSQAVDLLHHDPRAQDSRNHHRLHPHAHGHQTEQNLEKLWRRAGAIFSSQEGHEGGEQDGDGVMMKMGLGLGLEVGVRVRVVED